MEWQRAIEIAQKLSILHWTVFGVFLNLFLMGFSIGLHQLIEKFCSSPPLQEHTHPLKLGDVFWCVTTLICNVIALLVGVFLWKSNWIQLNSNADFIAVAAEVFVFVLAMDLLMYGFHYFAHKPFFYNSVHKKHHEHSSTNLMSLFVLHPVESLGFGLLLIGVLSLWSFSVLSLSIYLMINLVWGTIGHLNREFFPKKATKIAIGTTHFHNQHHLFEDKNFGFYTSIWDRLFKTYK